MEATEQILPHMSAAKQDRIRIWRHEVATAHLEPDHDALSSPGAAISSATSTTTSSSSSSRSAALVLARGRSILSKLADKLSLRPSASSGGGSFWRSAGPQPEEGASRTAMYATLSPDYNPDVVPADDYNGDDEISGEEAANPRDAVLREKQERLMRAAKLLDKSHANADGN